MEKTSMTKKELFSYLAAYGENDHICRAGIECVKIPKTDRSWTVYEQQTISKFKASLSFTDIGDGDIVIINDFSPTSLTVGQLIEKLKAFDPGMFVVVYCNETGGYAESVSVVTENNAPYFHADDWWSGLGHGENYEQIPKKMVCVSAVIIDEDNDDDSSSSSSSS